MREIKFRWWNAYDCKMVDFNFDDIYGGKIEFGALSFELDSPFVMQFTELQDSKGVDIYFDDVVYITGYGNLLVNNLGDLVILVDALAENDIGEILGNIHENEDLIEASK
jgi:hypothetical protein